MERATRIEPSCSASKAGSAGCPNRLPWSGVVRSVCERSVRDLPRWFQRLAELPATARRDTPRVTAALRWGAPLLVALRGVRDATQARPQRVTQLRCQSSRWKVSSTWGCVGVDTSRETGCPCARSYRPEPSPSSATHRPRIRAATSPVNSRGDAGVPTPGTRQPPARSARPICEPLTISPVGPRSIVTGCTWEDELSSRPGRVRPSVVRHLVVRDSVVSHQKEGPWVFSAGVREERSRCCPWLRALR
jgi:hypothetical protein